MGFTDNYLSRFDPWMTTDLETYLRAVAGMFSEVELLAFDTATKEGWTILFDPDRCPTKALPYLAQYVGERLPLGLPDVLQREWIKDAPNSRRGTIQSIVRAAQRTLIGQRHVSIQERVGAVSDALSVTTYISETPNAATVLADLQTVVPADIILTYQSLAGQVWSAITASTWLQVRTNYATWGELAQATTGATTFSRPRP